MQNSVENLYLDGMCFFIYFFWLIFNNYDRGRGDSYRGILWVLVRSKVEGIVIEE